MKTKVYMVSLGCPKNRVDSERTLWALKNAGAELTEDETKADLLIVNSCGFVDEAKEESVETILSLAGLKDKNRGVKLAVMGCLSERFRDELKKDIPEIDYLYGVSDLETIVRDLAPAPKTCFPDPDTGSRIITTSPHWAYIKAAEGCSNNCSFCVIPSIRGPYRSRERESLLDEAKTLAEQGVKELIVVAQDTTLYGADLKEKNGLAKLLRSFAAIDGLEWVRAMYMYPALVNDELLQTFAGEEKLVPYFDIPFQHVSDNVLKRMNRPESYDSIRTLVENIRRKVPQAAIRTSFIIGFPGETCEDFELLTGFLDEARFDHMGAFVFSPETGTSAFGLSGRVEERVANERYNLLMSRQKEIATKLNEEKVGKVYDVFVDRLDHEENLLTGRLKTQAPEIDGCVILDSVAADPGDIMPIRITGVADYDLIGTTP